MKIDIQKVKPNKNNPRVIKDFKFKKLVQSIQEFPEMLEKRPIVVDENMIVLGGNMRLKACIEAGLKKIDVIIAEGWSEKQKQEFIIKDNVGYGEWDWDVLANEWEITSLDKWGVNVPSVKNTELLSGLEYKSMYYEPKPAPDINLEDCINYDKYNAKVKSLDNYKLNKDIKEVLKVLAYRFIKIDFESVANYYYFNADDEEKKAIERLRLVLTDDGVNGFIEDDLLKILNYTDNALQDD